MLEIARVDCLAAMNQIQEGDYALAIVHLRHALRGTHNRRAWSKIMLAIRELSRIA